MESLYACLDNQAVVAAVYQKPKGTSAATLWEVRTLLKSWDTRCSPYHSTHLSPGTASVLWIPGHGGIFGNEAADKEASHGANLSLDLHSRQMSLAGAKKWAKTATNRDFLAYQNSLPTSWRLRPEYAQSHPPIELQFPRKFLARLLAAHSGYGKFAAYHDRFNHTEAEMRCRCGAFTAPTHFYYCRLNSGKKILQGNSGQHLTIKEILETVKGARVFLQWAEASNFFAVPHRPNQYPS